MEEIIQRYIEGKKLTPEELKTVIDWTEKDPKNLDMLSELKAKWVFNNLPNDIASEAKGENFIRLKNKNSVSNRLTLVITRIAAILFIPLALYTAIGFFNNNGTSINEINAPETISYLIPQQKDALLEYKVNPGVKAKITLPDGSNVWLNSGSTLKCPSRFDTLSRNVEFSGEGFFEVESNGKWPMYIKTQKGVIVEVRGTKFNLSTYSNDDEVKLTLVSGKVNMIRERINKMITVKPNNEIIIPTAIGAKGIRKIANIEYNTAWKEGILMFNNTPMPEIIKKLERWYGVDIEIKDKDILEQGFTGTFKSESITQVLDMLKFTSNISYIVAGKNVSLFF